MLSSFSSTASRLALSFLFLVSISVIPISQATFNYEVERRVFERVNDFMSGPTVVTGLLARFRKNGAFPHQLDPSDRDAFSTLSYSLLKEYEFDMIYYGTEDGIFVGYNTEVWGTYREPVNSGYNIEQNPEMNKYFKACVNRETGEPENCSMGVESQYIECLDDCELALCNDPITQECKDDSCKKEQKWCPQYATKTTHQQNALTTMGYVPRTYHCHTPTGVFSQEPGEILQEDGDLGNCLYGDGRTLVNRDLEGDYILCGENQTCNDVFVGGFRSRDYDPRYRTWYQQTKTKQQPNWAEPYVFFSNLDIGITFSTPFYTYDDESRRQIFRGVFAVDYTFEDISDFLRDSYGVNSAASMSDGSTSDETYVVIYEAKAPHYMIASSTGRYAASKVLESDPSVACPDDAKDDGGCVVKRMTMEELAGQPNDEILRASYSEQVKQNYPRDLVSARLSDEPGSDAYVSQSSFYSSGDDLEWVILVVSPIERSSSDALTKDDGLFGVVCVIASLGFSLCFVMFWSFFSKRKSRAVILADWRFTSAFIMGCALLNLSSFTFLGENTEALCLARMWAFHLLFAVVLSPLFVKVYRMYRLVGTPHRNPAIISNPMAFALALPIVAVQVIILAVFTIIDPPQPEDIIEIDGTVVTQRVECSTNTNAFTFTVLGFECGLVLIGCVLAFVTRNLDSGFGQAKELMFSMYNIAFIGIIIVVISLTMDIETSGQIILFSMGIFCATVFSCAVFVLPRLMQSKQEQRTTPGGSSPNASKSPRQPKPANQPKKNTEGRSVNFSATLERDIDEDHPDRLVTGWSGVEDDFEDAASGMKRASSVLSIPEDDIWTQPPDHTTLGSGNSLQRDITDDTEIERDDTWRSDDISDPKSANSSKQTSESKRGLDKQEQTRSNRSTWSV